MLFLLIFFLLLAAEKASATTTAVDLPYFVGATFTNGFLAVTVAFDTTNHTDVSITFTDAPACTFAAAGCAGCGNLFIVNQTWSECFTAPIDASGSVANNIEVASVWHTDLGALPTLYTLLLTLHFETTLQVASSTTVLATDKATVTIFQPEAVRATASPVATRSAGRSDGVAGAAAAGGLVGFFVIMAGLTAYSRSRRQPMVFPAVV